LCPRRYTITCYSLSTHILEPATDPNFIVTLRNDGSGCKLWQGVPAHLGRSVLEGRDDRFNPLVINFWTDVKSFEDAQKNIMAISLFDLLNRLSNSSNQIGIFILSALSVGLSNAYFKSLGLPSLVGE
jgi:hypothetical protein